MSGRPAQISMKGRVKIVLKHQCFAAIVSVSPIWVHFNANHPVNDWREFDTLSHFNARLSAVNSAVGAFSSKTAEAFLKGNEFLILARMNIVCASLFKKRAAALPLPGVGF
jgi:hypothetical protein